MNTDIPDWPEVSEAQFLALLGTFDYARDGWANAIKYRERHTGRVVGCEVGSARRGNLRYLVHPGLLAEIPQND